MDSAKLLSIPYDIYEQIFYHFKQSLKDTKYFKDINLRTGDGNIDCFTIRCNDYYVTNDMKRNNDYLVILEYLPEKVSKYCFHVTADPKTRKWGIANLIEQIYYGNIRNHHWTLGRDCIAQDNCKVWVRRYSNTTQYVEQEGNFTINIHNNGGFFNSSLGCTILADDKDFISDYRPLLRRCTNRSYIPVCVIRDTLFEQYLNAL